METKTYKKTETEQSFIIHEKLLNLSTSKNGKWNKTLTITSWYNDQPKFDIRSWLNNYLTAGKGVVLSAEELWEIINSEELKEILRNSLNNKQ